MPAHAETRILPYTAHQMFDLVADVEAYPAFLPWTAAARIRSVETLENGSEEMLADLVVSFKVFRERFGSRVLLWTDARVIETEYLDGPFKFLRSKWRFTDLDSGECEVAFDVEFAFKNRILQGTAELFFYEAMRRIVRAFEARAHALHGNVTPDTA